MRIGELAGAVSLPTKTIRYYEQIGVLPPPEGNPNGYLAYGDAARDRLRGCRERGGEPYGRVLELVDRRARDCSKRLTTRERMRADLRRPSVRARAGPSHDGSLCPLIEHAVP